VVEAIENTPSDFKFVYEDQDTLWEKLTKVAKKIYGAAEVVADTRIRGKLKQLTEEGYGHHPVCIAKTQYSFSTDPQLLGAPSNHVLAIREVRLAAGAEFVVAICGDVMTMPGLPEVPSAQGIDVDEQGRIVGLF
jgi:formate--tetrahydrofolate ligase